MAYYNYKRVVYRDDYAQAKKEIEIRDGEEYENSVDYDGDAWYVAEFLLDKKDTEIERLRAELEELDAKHCEDYNELQRKYKEDGELIEAYKLEVEVLNKQVETQTLEARELHRTIAKIHEEYRPNVRDSLSLKGWQQENAELRDEVMRLERYINEETVSKQAHEILHKQWKERGEWMKRMQAAMRHCLYNSSSVYSVWDAFCQDNEIAKHWFDPETGEPK